MLKVRLSFLQDCSLSISLEDKEILRQKKSYETQVKSREEGW